ncbi:BTAD domain-containing putative transcriptional regulator [Streptomyces sp. NPDC014603]|uniref:AfsR/SARP family transcriptional regulator n=1 Tax=unclassified Streptomyces TaxID=2593676 RepID=UPI0036D132E6
MGRQWDDGVVRRELRFGLLGTPVLYQQPSGAAAPIVQAVGSPKLRALLAALLMDTGRVVSVGALKDVLWGGTPPPSAQPSLHNHVARLRRLLDVPDRLVTDPTGYRLRVDEGELDVHVFDALTDAARAAHIAGDAERVVRACTDALALWRGAPLAGLPPEVGGYALVRRLGEARLLLLEWRYDAELGPGSPGGGRDRLSELVPELAALAAEHPLREAYHRQLMLALHRTGRRAEALAVHRDLRARLVEELGIEPGPGVRQAHVEVLRGAGGGRSGDPPALTVSVPVPVPGPASSALVPSPPALTPSSPALATSSTLARSLAAAVDGVSGASVRSGVAAAVPRPAQLPPPPAYFVGREEVREALCRVLVPSARSAASGASQVAVSLSAPAAVSPVAVVSGTAGVGKSALALRVAQDLTKRFSDGQLHINLHGATPGVTPLSPAQALTALLRDLGAAPCDIPGPPDAAAALLRSLLAPTRTLLVLDDAANAAQVRPLLPAGPGCAVIVTSRSPLTALDGAARFPLGPLSAEDSAALLSAVSGRDRLDAAHPLVALTGRLPLALRIVAARLGARRALTPEVLAGQLAATESRLPHLEYDDLSVRRSLDVAHDALAASERAADRDAALALCRVGALDLPGYGAPLLARLLGTDELRAEDALERLVDVALLEETAYGRYVPHDLVRDFARELAREAPCGGGRTLTREAAADGALPVPGPRTHPRLAAGRRTPYRALSGRPAGADVHEGKRNVVDTALRWYAAVADRALTAIVEPGLDRDDRRRATRTQPPGHADDVGTVPPFTGAADAFAWADRELENIVALVERYADDEEPGDRRAHLAVLLRLLHPCLLRRGRVAESETLGRAALRMARRLGDDAALAYALGDLAGVRFLTGRHNDALRLTDSALGIWRRLGTVSGIRRCLNNRGLLLEALGRYAESGAALRQSLAHSRQLNDPYGEAVTHSHLGNLYANTDPRAAIEQHRRSLAIGDAIGAVILRHSAHSNIGWAHLALGEAGEALPHFEESLRILGGHGDWPGESRTRLGLVRALRELGRTERAAQECDDLLARASGRADHYTGALARHQYGLLLRERGRTAEAYHQWRSALAGLEGTDAHAVAAELRDLLATTEDADGHSPESPTGPTGPSGPISPISGPTNPTGLDRLDGSHNPAPPTLPCCSP